MLLYVNDSAIFSGIVVELAYVTDSGVFRGIDVQLNQSMLPIQGIQRYGCTVVLLPIQGYCYQFRGIVTNSWGIQGYCCTVELQYVELYK